jgi:hypothetical protein
VKSFEQRSGASGRKHGGVFVGLGRCHGRGRLVRPGALRGRAGLTLAKALAVCLCKGS